MAHESDVRERTSRPGGAAGQGPGPGASPRTVGDVMTRAVVAVGREAPFKDVTRNMREWGVSALPVLEADGRVIGVVSEADLLAKEEYREEPPGLNEPRERIARLLKSGGLTAGDVMSSPAVSVHEDAQLTEAARIMARKQVKRLPVVDGEGRLTGIVSRSDLLKVFLREDEEIADEIRREVLSLLPGAGQGLRVDVEKGVATVRGELTDTSLVPVVARLIRSVEGVVVVRVETE